MGRQRQDRSDFFFEGEPVGHFVRDCPTGPGRYGYDPYRGPGHARFSRALDRGPAECSFPGPGRDLWLIVIGEEFVAGEPTCRWFVRVSEVRPRPRCVRRRWNLTPAFTAVGLLALAGAVVMIGAHRTEPVGWGLGGFALATMVAGLWWEAGRWYPGGRPFRRGA